MQRSIDEIATELVQLSKRDRLEIARFLLFLDSASSDASNDSSIVNAEWDQEIIDRVHAVTTGTAVGIDFDIAKKKIENRYVK